MADSSLLIGGAVLLAGLAPLVLLVRIEGHARRAALAAELALKIEVARARRDGLQVTEPHDPMRDRLGI